MKSIYLNIGSNKGDREAAVERAVSMIANLPLLAEGRIRRAPLFRSQPMGYASDAEFVNLGIAIDFAEGCALPDPFELLDALQAVEKKIAPDSPHRNADGTYRDRVVDIDIIAIDGIAIESPRLTVPHPRARTRRFVTEPLRFLASHDVLSTAASRPGGHLKKTVDQMGRDSVETFRKKTKLPLAVILDNIRSLNNVGSIFRTADAFCVNLVALCGITGTPPSAEIHKTALGAEEAVEWRHYADTMEAVEALRAEGYTIACLEQVHDSVSLNEFVPQPGVGYAIVAGNEVSGVDQMIVDACDVCLEIPQAGTKHSLNVAVSTAVALWHFFSHYRDI